MTPRLLAFDTSTDRLSAGLLTPGGVRAVDEAGGAAASARLIPLLQSLLAQAGVALGELDAVVFGQGPGAFTGLRTACAVAQGLAFGTARPVVAVDSLMIVAEAAAPGQDLWVAMDARMDEVYAAHYRGLGQGRWQVLREPALYGLPALAAAWQDEPPRCVAGSAVTAFAGRLPFGSARCLPEPAERAAALLRLGEAAWHDGAARDADTALPRYLRDKVAFTSAERAAGLHR